MQNRYKPGAIFSGKCEDPGLFEVIDVRIQVYSKLIAEYYAKYGGFWIKIKCNMSQFFSSGVYFWGFFQVNFVSLGLSFGHIGVDFEYPEVYFVLQRVQLIIIRFSVIVTI